MHNNRVHLHSRQGIYTVVYTTKTKACITCKAWNARAGYPPYKVTKIVPISDIKCKAGLPGDKKRRAKLKLFFEFYNAFKELEQQ